LSSYCPVCNGLESLKQACPACARSLTDCGRLDDLTGPYAPYRQIDDLKLTNGFDDLGSHRCIHLLHCPECKSNYTAAVSEWPAYS